ncbi:hypothetical protein FQA39_LY02041 [Lamprigera yunnana]|nr:hypothetical protein FQA39_LY02041 [Lamprigera yunnana]
MVKRVYVSDLRNLSMLRNFSRRSMSGCVMSESLSLPVEMSRGLTVAILAEVCGVLLRLTHFCCQTVGGFIVTCAVVADYGFGGTFCNLVSYLCTLGEVLGSDGRNVGGLARVMATVNGNEQTTNVPNDKQQCTLKFRTAFNLHSLKMDNDEKPGCSQNLHEKTKIVKKVNKKSAYKLTVTLTRYVVPHPIKLWKKFTTSRKQKKTSKKIDKELVKEDHLYYQILVMGGKASGKTSVCRQMQILYKKGYTTTQRKKFIKNIKLNLKELMLFTANRVSKFLDSEVNNKIHYLKNYNIDSDDSQDFLNCLECLWNDTQIQNELKNVSHHLVTTGKYFMNKIDELKQINYIPSNQDVLYCYEANQSIFEVKFQSGHSHYRMHKIPNLKWNKKKWPVIIDAISCLVFVIDCSAFLNLYNMGQLERNIDELNSIQENLSISYTSCIVFLNKLDLFSEKILEENISMDELYPDFLTYKNSYIHRDNSNVAIAKNFILHKFINRHKETPSNWYYHFTCAVNSEYMSDVFQECTNVITQCNKCGLTII